MAKRRKKRPFYCLIVLVVIAWTLPPLKTVLEPFGDDGLLLLVTFVVGFILLWAGYGCSSSSDMERNFFRLDAVTFFFLFLSGGALLIPTKNDLGHWMTLPWAALIVFLMTQWRMAAYRRGGLEQLKMFDIPVPRLQFKILWIVKLLSVAMAILLMCLLVESYIYPFAIDRTLDGYRILSREEMKSLPLQWVPVLAFRAGRLQSCPCGTSECSRWDIAMIFPISWLFLVFVYLQPLVRELREVTASSQRVSVPDIDGLKPVPPNLSA